MKEMEGKRSTLPSQHFRPRIPWIRLRCQRRRNLTIFGFYSTLNPPVLILAFVTLWALIFQPIFADTCEIQAMHIYVNPASAVNVGSKATPTPRLLSPNLLSSSQSARRLQRVLAFRVCTGSDRRSCIFLAATCGRSSSFQGYLLSKRYANHRNYESIDSR